MSRHLFLSLSISALALLTTSLRNVAIAQTVTHYVIVDLSQDPPVEVGVIPNNGSVDLSVNSSKITIEAKTSGSVGSIRLQLHENGRRVMSRVENLAPYRLNGDFGEVSLKENTNYQITSRIYPRADAGGRGKTQGTFRFKAIRTGEEDAVPPEGDITKPTIALTSPTNNQTVSGTVSLSASASDNVGVTKVEFYVDGAMKFSDGSSPYSYSLNTESLSDGNHTLQARAYDAAGNVGLSSNLTIGVKNTTEPPAPPLPPPSNSTCANAGEPKGVTAGTYPVLEKCDDFTGTKLNSSLWEPHYFWFPATNTEYISQNVSVRDGMLDLIAYPKQCPTGYFSGCDLSRHSNYALAQVNTHGLWDTNGRLYAFEKDGLVQVDMKVDAVAGIWSAFWMMTGDGLNNPEIDFEGLTKNGRHTQMYMTIHHKGGGQSQTLDTSVDYSDGKFHTLGIERIHTGSTSTVRWYVNGVLKKTVTGTAAVGKLYIALQNDIDAADFPNWEEQPNAQTFSKGPTHVYFKNFRVWTK